MPEISLDEYVRMLRADAEGLATRAKVASRDAAEQCAQLLRDTAPVGATQALKNSVVVVDTPDGAAVEIQAPHAMAVEYGSAPHWAPIAPLILWAEWLGMGRDFAYAVRAKIAREGTKPTGWVRSLLPKMAEIAAEVGREWMAKRR